MLEKKSYLIYREELDQLQTEREQMKELADKLRHSNDMIEQLLEDKVWCTLYTRCYYCIHMYYVHMCSLQCT